MTPSQNIDQQIAAFADWRGKCMGHLRKLIHQADPEITEDWKWETGVFVKNGLVCAVSAFKDHVKINFFKGALLKDKHKLINAGLESKRNKAIDFSEGDPVNEQYLQELIVEAVALNKK